MDTRFSSAIHTLILIAGAEKPLHIKEIDAGQWLRKGAGNSCVTVQAHLKIDKNNPNKN